MRKLAIIVDLDNTLVDTAIRKYSLLKDFLPHKDVPEDKVRQDFDLVTILGGRDTDANKGFMTRLDSDDAIRKHPAPLFQGVTDVLKSITQHGVEVVVMTGRPASLTVVTTEELTRLSVQQFVSAVHLRPLDAASVSMFKDQLVSTLLQRYDVIAVIGDHQDDFSAATAHNIPFIQLTTTPLPPQPQNSNVAFAGGAICRSWDEVRLMIETILEGRKKLTELRRDFTDSYARWLADLDNKARVIATISGILATLAGKFVFDLKQPLRTYDYILVASFIIAVLSLLYCIRSITSRRTSGAVAGLPIIADVKQMFAILVGAPHRWQCKQDDPVDIYRRLLIKRPEEQARAHYDFFLREFKTYDPEALANLRLHQLRSVNYAKAYAETLASKLLASAILLFVVWFIWHIAVHVPPQTGTP